MSLKGLLVILAIIFVGGFLVLTMIGLAIQWAGDTLESFLAENPAVYGVIVIWLLAIAIAVIKIAFGED